MSIARFFYFLAGTSEVVIEDCPPAERNYHAAIGGFVLITAVLASLSGGYALYTVFHGLIPAIGFGLFWGLAIGAIDRFVVMTIDLTSSVGRFRTLMSASFRLLLAMFVAVVVARPLELRIFEPEIAGHLEDGVRQRLGQQVDALQADLRHRQEAYEGTRRLAQEQDANAALATACTDCRSEADELRDITHHECDGTGGSRRIGAGPVCKLKREDQQAAEARCADLEARRVASDATIAALRVENEKVYAEMRTATEQRIGEVQAAAGARIAEIEDGQTGSLLTRLDALYALSAQSSGMEWVIGFVTALFVLVESLPVGLKLMVAGIGTYAGRVHLDEEEASKRHRIERRHREYSRYEHRRAMRTIAGAVREQTREHVLETVSRGADVVTDDVNLELRRRTEVISRDLTQPREVFPPSEASVEPSGVDDGEITRELPFPGPRSR